MPGLLGRLAGLGRAHRLARGRHQAIQLAGLGRADQRVDERRQLFPRRDGDAGLAPLKLDGLGAVVDGHHDVAGGVGAPPGPDPLLFLDLAPFVALAGPALDGSDVGGVRQQLFLFLQALGQLGPAVGDGVVGTRWNAGEREVLEDRHDLSPVDGDRIIFSMPKLVHGWTQYCHVPAIWGFQTLYNADKGV